MIGPLAIVAASTIVAIYGLGGDDARRTMRVMGRFLWSLLKLLLTVAILLGALGGVVYGVVRVARIAWGGQ